MLGDLRTRFFASNGWPKIDNEFYRGLTRFRKILRGDDGANTDIDSKEIIKSDQRPGGRVEGVGGVHVGVSFRHVGTCRP